MKPGSATATVLIGGRVGNFYWLEEDCIITSIIHLLLDMKRGTFVYPSRQPGGGSSELRRQLGYLKDFLYQFSFI